MYDRQGEKRNDRMNVQRQREMRPLALCSPRDPLAAKSERERGASGEGRGGGVGVGAGVGVGVA